MSISAPTLLRHIKAVPCSLPQNVRVLGIDDWCWKRGQNYGTILVDLETHTVVDLLPDRSADSVQRWLEARPGIEIVSRDRGGIYADGAARGAKDAQQVADRWHLVKNLGDAVEKYLVRQRIQVPPLPQVQVKEVKAHVSQEANLPLKHRRLQAKRERKQELCEQARALAAQGWGMRSIAAHLGLARNTVRRYLRSEGDIPVATRPRQKSILDPYYDYIVERWQQGCPTARQLFQELCKKGYKGGETTVRDCVAHLRQSLPEMKRPPRGAKGPMPYTGCSYSPRELRWLLAKSEKNLRPEEKANLTRLLEASDEVRLLHRLLQQFLQMVRERKLTQLQSWLEEAFSSGIAELQGFVRGIERDRAAVEAALSLPWSQGQTEGQVNRLKMLKRQMYGRAGFTLLRQRVLHRA
jgi:transposase